MQDLFPAKEMPGYRAHINGYDFWCRDHDSGDDAALQDLSPARDCRATALHYFIFSILDTSRLEIEGINFTLLFNNSTLT
jgi:hypothetical protein